MRTTTMRALVLAMLTLFAGTVAAAAPTTPAAPASAPIDKALWAWVTTDATGVVTAVENDRGQNEAIAGIVDGLARALRFAPATKAGVAMSSVVPVQLGVRFVPEANGDYAASLRWAKVEAVRYDAPPPRYPSGDLRGRVGGWVLLGLVATGDAAPASIEVLDSGAFRDGRVLTGRESANTFSEASLQAAARWTMRTATVADAPVSVRVGIPFTFRPWNRVGGSDEFPPAAQATQKPTPDPQIVTPDVALPRIETALPESAPTGPDRIETTGSRVRRGSVSM